LATASSASQVTTIRLQLTVQGDARIDVKKNVTIEADVSFEGSGQKNYSFIGQNANPKNNSLVIYQKDIVVRNGNTKSDKIQLNLGIDGTKTVIELNPKYIMDSYYLKIDFPNVKNCSAGIFRAIKTPANTVLDHRDSIKIIVKTKLTKKAMINSAECKHSADQNEFDTKYLISAVKNHGQRAVFLSGSRILKVL
jgi:hypothetical protein